MKLSAIVAVALIISDMVLPVHAATKSGAPAAVQKEFNGFIAKFRKAVKANDHVAVAGLTKLPFQGDQSVSTAEQFYQNVYKVSFTKSNRTCIGKEAAVYDRDDYGQDNYMIFCGELIFVFTKLSDGFLFTDISVND